MTMALLIRTCAALEELTVSVDFLLHNEWFPTMLKYGVQQDLFGKLKKSKCHDTVSGKR
jgi:hypothetical protein